MDTNLVAGMADGELIEETRAAARRSCEAEADLLVLLGEIDERRLYLSLAASSMYAFCTGELGFAEGAAYNRITVARAARRFPAIIEAIRSGRVHLAGMRVLVPHLTEENCDRLLELAAGKTRDQIWMLVAPFAGPHPPVRSSIVPLTAGKLKFEFTADVAFRDKLEAARDLLGDRVASGDLEAIFDCALDALIRTLKKKRFGVGAAQRRAQEDGASRRVPAALRNAVFERDAGQCTFTDDRGKRCAETRALQIDHIDGFARTRKHELDKLRLLCPVHNQHVADLMYGRDFMEKARGRLAPGRVAAESPPDSRCGS